MLEATPPVVGGPRYPQAIIARGLETAVPSQHSQRQLHYEKQTALKRTCWQRRGSTPHRWKHDRTALRLIALSAKFLSLAALHHSLAGQPNQCQFAVGALPRLLSGGNLVSPRVFDGSVVRSCPGLLVQKAADFKLDRLLGLGVLAFSPSRRLGHSRWQ